MATTVPWGKILMVDCPFLAHLLLLLTIGGWFSLVCFHQSVNYLGMLAASLSRSKEVFLGLMLHVSRRGQSRHINIRPVVHHTFSLLRLCHCVSTVLSFLGFVVSPPVPKRHSDVFLAYFIGSAVWGVRHYLVPISILWDRAIYAVYCTVFVVGCTRVAYGGSWLYLSHFSWIQWVLNCAKPILGYWIGFVGWIKLAWLLRQSANYCIFRQKEGRLRRIWRSRLDLLALSSIFALSYRDTLYMRTGLAQVGQNVLCCTRLFKCSCIFGSLSLQATWCESVHQCKLITAHIITTDLFCPVLMLWLFVGLHHSRVSKHDLWKLIVVAALKSRCFLDIAAIISTVVRVGDHACRGSQVVVVTEHLLKVVTLVRLLLLSLTTSWVFTRLKISTVGWRFDTVSGKSFCLHFRLHVFINVLFEDRWIGLWR